MRALRRILVAVKDPDAKSLPAVEKGAQLARASGAELEVFHAITERLSADACAYLKGGIVEAEQSRRKQYVDQLEKIAAPLRKAGLIVDVSVKWDYPAYEAIVRQARRSRADLIVAECHAGRRLAPWLLHVTDWELLRTSPVPVLLVKTPARYHKPVVLAAIDPTHAYAKPSKLDDAILAAARAMTEKLNGSMHAMHAYLPEDVMAASGGAITAALASEMFAAAESRAKKSFERALRKTKLPRERRHLQCGMPVDAIPGTAREIGAALVVMGAVSRSGLKRLFIGNTAERVLNDLPCDILVVKPARFVSRVPRRSRGVRLVATPQFGVPA